MQKIVPNLWCEGNAREMAEFYVSVFPGSKITGDSKYPDSKEEGLADFQADFAGKDLTIEFNLAGHDFVGINAGPEFKPTPALSFMVNFDPSHDEQAREHLDQVWDKLIDGGEALMEIGEYPYSKRYGWVKDKYGYTWQLMLTNPDGEDRPCIIPSFMFCNDNANRAEEAINFYTSLFEDAKIGMIARYEQDVEPVKKSSVMFGDFMLAGQWFAAMDAPGTHDFGFSEAVSLAVNCKDQAEIDRLWAALSAVPDAEQCGWCKDKFGVSWQIVPENMAELMRRPNAFNVLMNQHKIVIADY